MRIEERNEMNLKQINNDDHHVIAKPQSYQCYHVTVTKGATGAYVYGRTAIIQYFIDCSQKLQMPGMVYEEFEWS